jgi:hypothetical protein
VPSEIHGPELGESVADATVGRWLKQEGETVKSGVLQSISKDEGETVNVGEVIGTHFFLKCCEDDFQALLTSTRQVAPSVSRARNPREP